MKSWPLPGKGSAFKIFLPVVDHVELEVKSEAQEIKDLNGIETILLAEDNGPVSLMLTDVVMPGMNGRDIYEKAIEMHPDLKVLYMSGYTTNVIAHHGILEKGVAFIQKPFTARDLATKIRKVLG